LALRYHQKSWRCNRVPTWIVGIDFRFLLSYPSESDHSVSVTLQNQVRRPFSWEMTIEGSMGIVGVV
jgi:hypothetical protein